MAITKTVNVETTNARASTTLTDTTPTVPLPDTPQGLMVIGPQVTLHFIEGAWNQANSYDYYDVVQVDGTSYIAVQDVPANTPITNTEYWAKWNDPNAQVELLQNTVSTFDARITAAQEAATSAEQGVTHLSDEVDKKLSGVYNVMAYGANGDGVTDNYTAFTNAIAAASEGGTVYVPAGTYFISQTISVTNPVSIIGSNWFNTTLLFPANTDGLSFNITANAITESSNGPKISNLTVKTQLEYWDNRDNNNVTSGIGIKCTANGVSIDNVMVWGFYTGLNTSGKGGGTVRCNVCGFTAFRCRTGIENTVGDIFYNNINVGPCYNGMTLNGGTGISNAHIWGYTNRGLYHNGHFNISNLELESPFTGNVIHVQNGSNGYGTINGLVFWYFPDYSDASTKWALVYNEGLINISNLVYTRPKGGTTSPYLVTCASTGCASITNAILGPTVTDIGNGSDHTAVSGSGVILYDYCAKASAFQGLNAVTSGAHHRTNS